LSEDKELGLRSWLTGPKKKGPKGADTGSAIPLASRRVAVLPLVSLSPDPNDEYFADGITEEMISTLSNIRELTVISRTSVMQYKNAKKNLADIGKELQASTMLEGSVRKSGNRVRITVQLLDAIEDKHLWSRSYERELQDIFAVQSDIARNVAEAVKVELLSANQIQKRPTTNTEAYLLYLRGKQEWNKRTEEGARNAIKYFTQALEHDSNFALAYTGLADSYFVMEAKGAMTPTEATEKAKAAILNALQLDKRLAEAHASHARLLEYDHDWDAAEAEYGKAIDLNPSYASAHQWYSFLLGMEGRWEDALGEAEKALELDPLSAVVISNVSHRLLFMKRYEEAMEYAKKSLTIQPDLLTAVVSLVLGYAYKGESFEAVAQWEKYAQHTLAKTRVTVFLAAIQALVGRKGEAISTLDSAKRLPDFGAVPPTLVAWVFAALRDEDKMFEWLEKAMEKGDTMVTSINDNIVFRDYHSRPRYLDIMKKLGFDKYQTVKGVNLRL
jgi:TolB-like protein/Tfp pilus assembly protein PilF